MPSIEKIRVHGVEYDISDTSKSPTNHASSTTNYGKGNASNYGHVKLSDSINSTYGANDGVSATPKAVHDLDVKHSANKLVASSSVNLSNYEISSPYTFPSDGYVVSMGDLDILMISGADMSRTIQVSSELFVRKGMKGWGAGSIYFYPLS